MVKKMRTEHVASTFDTYSIIKRLMHRGFKEPQAKELVDILSESREFDIGNLATKVDIADTKLDIAEVKHEISDVEKRLSVEISDVEKRLSIEIEKVRHEVS